MTKAAAVEYGDRGIRAIAICPGFILTEIMGASGGAHFPEMFEKSALEAGRAAVRGGGGGSLPRALTGPRSSPAPSSPLTEDGPPSSRDQVEPHSRHRAGRPSASLCRDASRADRASPGAAAVRQPTPPSTCGRDACERIVAAGSEVIHGFPIWDWGALTVRAVAHRAGMNERTVYRYFANERELRDAVMQRLEHEAGVDLDGLQLEGVANAAARIFEYASLFPFTPRTPRDPTVAAANQLQRQALLAAVSPWTEGWPDGDSAIAAAMLDVLWSVVSYERLVVDWKIDPREAIRGITWVIGLVEDAVRQGRGPGSGATPGLERSATREER